MLAAYLVDDVVHVDDGGGTRLVHQPPEVHHGVRQRVLCHHEPPAVTVGLQWKESIHTVNRIV